MSIRNSIHPFLLAAVGLILVCDSPYDPFNEPGNAIGKVEITSKTGAYHTGKDVAEANGKRKLLSAGSIGGFVLGGLGVAGFAVTWVF